jgi:hypothetical protein
MPQPYSASVKTMPDRTRQSAPEGDFARILELIASDPAFERALLDDPDGALRPFTLDPDEQAVLRTYRRWRIPF